MINAVVYNNGDNTATGDNNDERKIMVLLTRKLHITAKEMSVYTGFSTRKISRIMRELRETGRIVRVGPPRKGYWEIKDSIEIDRNLLDIISAVPISIFTGKHFPPGTVSGAGRLPSPYSGSERVAVSLRIRKLSSRQTVKPLSNPIMPTS